MLDIGRVCTKIGGRETGKICVIVDNENNNFVLIDGNVKRRHCNIKHLEPLETVLKIKKGASTDSVLEAMKEAGIEVKVEKRIKRTKKTLEEKAPKVTEKIKPKKKK